MTREDVEDQHRAIDDRHRDDLLEIFALARAKIVEDEHELRIEFLHQIGNLTRFAAADKRRRIDLVALLHQARNDLRAGGMRERFEFYQFGFEWSLGVIGVDSDDNRSISQRSPSL